MHSAGFSACQRRAACGLMQHEERQSSASGDAVCPTSLRRREAKCIVGPPGLTSPLPAGDVAWRAGGSGRGFVGSRRCGACLFAAFGIFLLEQLHFPDGAFFDFVPAVSLAGFVHPENSHRVLLNIQLKATLQEQLARSVKVKPELNL